MKADTLVSTMDGVSLEALPTGLIVGSNAFVTVRNSVIAQSGSTGVSIGGSNSSGNIENTILNNNATAICQYNFEPYRPIS